MKQENLFDLGPDWTGFDKDVHRIVGAEASLRPEQTESFRVAEAVPGRVVFPESVAQVSGLVEAIRKRGLCAVPLGLGAHTAAAGAPNRPFVAISLSRLARSIDFQPANMTLTIEAGATLEGLRAVAAKGGQWLPLDPPWESKTTVGGLIAGNLSGPARFSQGTVRDLLIGLRVVAADGSILTGGGRVVKNVAGYDLPKLFCGSEGTLGVVVEATFKLRPLPEAIRILRIRSDSGAGAQEILRTLLLSGLEPFFLELMSFVPLGGFGYNFIVGFAGSTEQVSYQVEQARSALDDKGVLEELSEREAETAMHELRNFRVLGKSQARVKASLVPTKVIPFVRRVEAEGGKSGLRIALQAHAGNGIVYARIRAGQVSDELNEHVAGVIERLRAAAEDLGGSLVLAESSQALRERVGAWGSAVPAVPLMRKVKQALDPANILSPGRLFS